MKILISCSFSPQARSMIKTALAFSKSLGGQNVFCHVAEEHEDVRQKVLTLLEELGAVNPIIIIRPGAPDQVIRKLAKEISADLIIAGALEHEGTIVGILGSVARRIVRKAPCSVLLLTGASIRNDHFKTLVTDVHYDWASRRMSDLVADLARRWNAFVHVVHTYDFSLRFLEYEEIGDSKRIAQYEHECAAEECQRLNDFVERGNWSGVGLRCICLRKEGSELTQYAKKVDADLLVIPAPPQIAYWQRFFNPPAEVLLQDMPCSVLFYRGTS